WYQIDGVKVPHQPLNPYTLNFIHRYCSNCDMCRNGKNSQENFWRTLKFSANPNNLEFYHELLNFEILWVYFHKNYS
ncbi:hypothetical protein, partial [Kingella denitrificans]